MPVRAHAEKGDDAWTVAPHLASEACASGDELCRRELIGTRCGSADEVGKSVTQSLEGFLFRRMEEARREPGAVQRGPETIAGAGEVVAGRGGVKAGVDAAEEYLETRRDDIAQLLAARRRELCRARPA